MTKSIQQLANQKLIYVPQENQGRCGIRPGEICTGISKICNLICSLNHWVQITMLSVTLEGRVPHGDDSHWEGFSQVIIETTQLFQALGEGTPLSVQCVRESVVLVV